MNRVARQVVVTGRVQGVSFRAYAEQQAHRLGVDGWVANEPDGSLVAYLEGDPDAVAAMVEWCRTGPPSARVEDVQAESVEPGGATDFVVRG